MKLLKIKKFQGFILNASEIPCQIIVGLHEWRHDCPAVSPGTPANLTFSWRGEKFSTGRWDPEHLYFKLLLFFFLIWLSIGGTFFRMVLLSLTQKKAKLKKGSWDTTPHKKKNHKLFKSLIRQFGSFSGAEASKIVSGARQG